MERDVMKENALLCGVTALRVRLEEGEETDEAYRREKDKCHSRYFYKQPLVVDEDL